MSRAGPRRRRRSADRFAVPLALAQPPAPPAPIIPPPVQPANVGDLKFDADRLLRQRRLPDEPAAGRRARDRVDQRARHRGSTGPRWCSTSMRPRCRIGKPSRPTTLAASSTGPATSCRRDRAVGGVGPAGAVDGDPADDGHLHHRQGPRRGDLLHHRPRRDPTRRDRTQPAGVGYTGYTQLIMEPRWRPLCFGCRFQGAAARADRAAGLHHHRQYRRPAVRPRRRLLRADLSAAQSVLPHSLITPPSVLRRRRLRRQILMAQLMFGRIGERELPRRSADRRRRAPARPAQAAASRRRPSARWRIPLTASDVEVLGMRGDAVAAHPQPPVGDVTAVEQVQLVGLRVAQRPHVGRGAQQHVDREDRHCLGQPADRVDDARADVAVVLAGCTR